jgi:hypothetical protein
MGLEDSFWKKVLSAIIAPGIIVGQLIPPKCSAASHADFSEDDIPFSVT